MLCSYFQILCHPERKISSGHLQVLQVARHLTLVVSKRERYGVIFSTQFAGMGTGKTGESWVAVWRMLTMESLQQVILG